MKPRLIFCTLLLFYLSMSSQAVIAESAITFDDIWIAEAPPVSKVLAAYMSITNHSDKTVKIKSVTAEGFSGTAFHKTVMEDGMAKMRHLDALTLLPHKITRLTPGGMHMMLFNPDKRLVAGDQVKMTFTREDGNTINVIANVKHAD